MLMCMQGSWQPCMLLAGLLSVHPSIPSAPACVRLLEALRPSPLLLCRVHTCTHHTHSRHLHPCHHCESRQHQAGWSSRRCRLGGGWLHRLCVCIFVGAPALQLKPRCRCSSPATSLPAPACVRLLGALHPSPLLLCRVHTCAHCTHSRHLHPCHHCSSRRQEAGRGVRGVKRFAAYAWLT